MSPSFESHKNNFYIEKSFSNSVIEGRPDQPASSAVQSLHLPNVLDMYVDIFGHVKHTVPIISRCSCRPKLMALPLKNHLKVGSRDVSQDTSQGSTRLWPTLASRLSGGTVIMVGSKGVSGGRRSSNCR